MKYYSATAFLILFIFVGSHKSYSYGFYQSQPQNYGPYHISTVQGWNFNPSASAGDNYVFTHVASGIYVSILKTPWLCESKQEMNKIILQIIQDHYRSQEFMEQRKQAVPVSCLGEKSGHLLIIKPREGNQRKFILNFHIGSQLHQMIVGNVTGNREIPADALHFLSNISLEPLTNQLLPKASQKAQEKVAQAPERQSDVKKEEVPEAFKKIKDPVPANTADTKTKSDAQKDDKTETATTTKPATQEKQTTESWKPVEEKPIPEVSINKGTVPEVKFAASEPCKSPAPNGLPWEKTEKTKVQLPKGVDVVMPPLLPDNHQLSGALYNSAVSAAFEGMRLVYGPMPDDEVKKFEAAWTPLFDYPTKEIVDYLNKLNPLVSQFLATRESYMRTLKDVQMIWFDASTAIEADEQQAWEALMAEAGLYISSLPPLESAMKLLAGKIEDLGNPPNPNDAKCEAQKRYKRMLAVESPEGCWAGYQDNIFISDGKYNMFQSDETPPEVFGLVHNPKYVYIYKVIQNGKEKYYSILLDIDVNIGFTDTRGNCTAGGFGDDFIRENIMGNTTYTGHWIDGPRLGQESQYIEKFEYPNIPEFPKVSEAQIREWIALDTEHNKGYWTKTFNEMLQMHALAPEFYEIAERWTLENRWQEFDYPETGWRCPDDVLLAFCKEMSAVKTEKEKTGNETTSMPTAAKPQETQPKQSVKEQAEQDRMDAIAFHTEMVGVIKNNLEKDLAERDVVVKSLANAKDQKEAGEHLRRLKDLEFRIIGLQSNMQSEQDLIASHQTGELVHTRTVFDDYARNIFIADIRENAARVDATRRIAQGIERQIELLPWEMRSEARERARKILDGKTIASGDLEKAKQLVNAINEQVQGYAEYDRAQAQEAEVDASQNEFYAQTTVMAAGAIFVGFGSAALAQAYGAEAAIAIYGPQVLGSLYGGATGLVAGGPKEGLTQAISWASPKGFAAVQFYEGYQNAGYQKDATTSTKIWEGVKQAGTAYFLGKGIEMGARLVAGGSLLVFGKDSRLFKPVISPPSQRSKQVLDAMRTSQKIANAGDDIKSYQNLEIELAMLKRDPVANSQKVQQLEKELQQLAASLNADYYAKWMFKYKTSPGLRRQFDLRVQKNYTEMTPGMIKRLEQKGYNMEGFEFRQFRNSTSGGSSSMDLDLGPVSKRTGKEPAKFYKKDGTEVDIKTFMDDAQAAMNAEYRQIHGLSAPSSDMNLVTSAHREAFATPKLLDKNIDFSSFTAEEVASIGKVLNVKMEGINKNQMLTTTSKMQAKCRESAKEIENMLLRKLRSDLQKATPGSPQQKQIQADINYWEDMLGRFRKMSMDETNPMNIIDMNRQIMKDTGGKDVTGVINDLQRAFGTK